VSHQQQQGKVPSAARAGEGLISCNSREGLQQQGRSATAGKVCNSRGKSRQPAIVGEGLVSCNSRGRSRQLQQQGKVTSAARGGRLIRGSLISCNSRGRLVSCISRGRLVSCNSIQLQ
jgi:hypothetical protein